MVFHEAIRKEKKKFTFALPQHMVSEGRNNISFWGFHEKIVELLFEEIFVKENYRINCNTATPLIVDCGANIGLSVIYLKLKYPNATIHAFEPDAETFAVLQENISMYKFNNVTLHQKAVTTKTGPVNFYVNANINAMPLMSLNKNELATEATQVEAISFADFLKDIDSVDFCKLDVEGAESSIVTDLANRNLLRKAAEWIIEYHPWAAESLAANKFVSLFQSAGFKTEIIDEQPKHPNYPTSGNTLYRFTADNIK